MRRHSAGLLLVVQPLHGFPLPFDLYCLLANQVIYGVVVEVLGSNVRNFLCASLFCIFLRSLGSVSFRHASDPELPPADPVLEAMRFWDGRILGMGRLCLVRLRRRIAEALLRSNPLLGVCGRCIYTSPVHARYCKVREAATIDEREAITALFFDIWRC